MWKNLDINTLPGEEWKSIIKYKGQYEISNIGRVKSLGRFVNINGGSWFRKERILKQNLTDFGYLTIGFLRDRKKKWFFVHRLIGDAFLTKEVGDTQINHKDGIKTNNNVSNLEWVTAQENSQHSVVNKFRNPAKGETHYKAILSTKQVKIIHKKYKIGYSHRQLADEFNVHYNTIYCIVKGKTRKGG